MSVVFTETIIPWILGTLLLLVVFTFGVAVKSWRDMKQSPYFFMRRQAEKRLQTYLSTSLVLLLLTTAVSAYAWRNPTDNINRVALLVNAKPPRDEIVKLVESNPSAPNSVDLVQTLDTQQEAATSTYTSTKPILPSEFDQYDPTAKLKDNTELGSLSFSTEIDDRYEAVNPGKIFGEGFYTLYATFDYSEMEDGMAWAWVWRHNGQVVEGGNELWNYGNDGPGYIYLNPEEGFQPGDYSLDVWVNGELLTRSAITINNAAISAGN
ncbi:MAG: hypothetical protein H6659_16170 [Ardenticatenaceae bacterium]|nr:hypothetical protein [Ardenticatenaceae bacterium]MCB8988136.1 hypothetical protein [Ardenticatenaceae bacterium]